jgi:dipeptide transport system substrate-binding protein
MAYTRCGNSRATLRRPGCCLLAGIALGLGLGAQEPARAAEKTLVFCASDGPVGLQPALVTDAPSYEASSHTIYDRLIDFKPGTTELEPALAKSWDISPDGLQYTLHLRDDVPFQSNYGFHPTRRFNADDVLFTFNRMADKHHPYHDVSGGTYTYFDSMDLDKMIASIDKVDDHTVRFVLRQPSAPFLADLAMDFASIDSAEYAEQLAREGRKPDLDLKPVGTGPFQLVSYVPGSSVRFKSFDAYWRGKPRIDKLVFAITHDASVRWAKMRAGECQVMEYPGTSDMAAMRADKTMRVLSGPGLNLGYLAFNSEHKPMQDARVRRALGMAINKKAIVDAVFGSAAEPARSPLPPSMWTYDSAIQDAPFDPAAAKKLLAEAGYPHGFDTDIWAVANARGMLRDPTRIAVMIQSNWADIGVRAKFVNYEWGEYLKRLANAEHSSALIVWASDNGDPDNFLAILLSCSGVHTSQNLSEYCSKPFDALMEKARTTSDPAQRTRMYREGQNMFQADLPFVPLMNINDTFTLSQRVHGFQLHPASSGAYFYGVSLD